MELIKETKWDSEIGIFLERGQHGSKVTKDAGKGRQNWKIIKKKKKWSLEEQHLEGLKETKWNTGKGQSSRKSDKDRWKGLENWKVI